MDYQVLNTELTTDPLTRGYAGMTDEEAATDLNTVYRTLPVDTVPGSDIFNNTDDAEYGALTAEQQNRWLNMCGVTDIDVSSGVAKSLEAELFGVGTTTRSNLAALKTRDVSRGEELGFGLVRVGDVEFARGLS
jgi:predicted flap endonuclease-1-like 5' DNA nuclease